MKETIIINRSLLNYIFPFSMIFYAVIKFLEFEFLKSFRKDSLFYLFFFSMKVQSILQNTCVLFLKLTNVRIYLPMFKKNKSSYMKLRSTMKLTTAPFHSFLDILFILSILILLFFLKTLPVPLDFCAHHYI